ncbi:hypothetical protein GKS17_02590 [Streptococcus uberis]|uniref:hypothetical protein n=1 Tax=Streptococcus uberis TaxID=1349 RepID=UPI0012B5DBEE|nr:hypothetical protein [Streptococcus uberis]MTB42216.1 hypothetical protein [Streptococcus uberis]MTC90919.1 hypothetical protein [Streptococcus uberis]MTC95684.1 hypothetical protein [Streptococcus uberis]
MKKNSLREVKFDDTEILVMNVDILNQKLCPYIKMQNTLDSINRELQHFMGLPPKKYDNQLLYIISEECEFKNTIIEHLEYFHFKMGKVVKRITSVNLVFELSQNSFLFEQFDFIVIEEIDAFYNCSNKIQSKLAKLFLIFLENGGKLLISGTEFDNSNDPLSRILYQGSLLNLTN